ncbi:membrane integrity-associated transporter subunit PqiC [bacterium]|nr:membrane integrity-associated transporter subunit PqiC [bacterium]
MSRGIVTPAAAALAAALAAGCASAPARLYTLRGSAAASDAPPLARAVLVGPVTVPGAVDRPEIVVTVGPNRVEAEEFNRWAGPLPDAIARVVAGDLSALLGAPEVAVAPLANFRADYRVSIDVQRFDSVPRQHVVLDAVWVVHASAGGAARSGRTVADEPVRGDGYDAIAAAHGAALARLSADIAAAIRAASAG